MINSATYNIKTYTNYLELVPWPCFSKEHQQRRVHPTKHSPTYWNYRTTRWTSDNATPTTTATIPYIKGTPENISRILQPSIFTSLTNPLLHYVSYWLTSKTKTNRGTDREQFIRSIAPTVTPPKLMRLAETSQPDWLNTNERRGKAMSTITLLNITDFTNHTLTGFTGTL